VLKVPCPGFVKKIVRSLSFTRLKHDMMMPVEISNTGVPDQQNQKLATLLWIQSSMYYWTLPPLSAFAVDSTLPSPSVWMSFEEATVDNKLSGMSMSLRCFLLLIFSYCRMHSYQMYVAIFLKLCRTSTSHYGNLTNRTKLTCKKWICWAGRKPMAWCVQHRAICWFCACGTEQLC